MQYSEEYGQTGQPINIGNLPKLSSGAAWYIAALPLLGIILQSLAYSFYVGVYLWAAVIVMSIVACVLDCRRIEKIEGGCYAARLKATVFLPIVYLFNRRRLVQNGGTIFALGLVWLIMALFSNGFVVSYGMDEDDYIDTVKTTYIWSMEEYENEATSEELSVYFDEYFDEAPAYQFEQDGDTRIVTVSGKKNGVWVRLAFSIVNDGFATTDFSLDEVSRNEEVLEGDERKALTDEIFLTQTTDAETEAQSEADITQSTAETVKA